MIVSHKPFRTVPPEQEDIMTAVRTASFMVAVAALWFFVSPWAYGFSLQESAANAWAVGALMVVFAGLRLLAPRHTGGFSRVNSVLAVWVFLSPWIYGFASQSARLTNCIAVGTFIFVLSMISASTTARPRIHQAH